LTLYDGDVRWLDAVVRGSDGRYRLADPVFGLWLSWRQPGGTVVPMQVIDDEAEQQVAQHLARMGFDLVYPSRASRGGIRPAGHMRSPSARRPGQALTPALAF